MNRHIKSQNGFTLIELLGVGAIIAILALVAIPTITGAINSSKVNGATETASVMRNALLRYYATTVDGSSNGSFPVASTATAADTEEEFIDLQNASSTSWAEGYWATPANPNYDFKQYLTDANGTKFVLCLTAKDSNTQWIKVTNSDAPSKIAGANACTLP